MAGSGPSKDVGKTKGKAQAKAKTASQKADASEKAPAKKPASRSVKKRGEPGDNFARRARPSTSPSKDKWEALKAAWFECRT